MRLAILSILICMLLPNGGFFESAYPLDKGSREVGLFQPLRFGLRENLELSTQPIYSLVMPNITIKKGIFYRKDMGLSARLHLNYPTLFFRMLQKPGMFGLLPTVADIGKVPHILFSRLEAIGSKELGIGPYSMLLSVKTGINISFSSLDTDNRFPIELPIVYHRMLVQENGIGLNMGVDARLIYSDFFSVLTDVDLFMVKNADKLFWEHKLVASFKTSKVISLDIGYKLTKDYPNIDRLRILPLLDIRLRWPRK